MTRRGLRAACFVLPLAASAHAATVTIVNGGFDTGSDGSATIAGWTDSAPATPGFWLQDGLAPGSFPQDPSEPQAGALYLTGNRLAGGASSQPASSTLSQTITLDLTNLTLVATGNAEINLRFYYQDTDVNDAGSVSLTFLNGSSAVVSTLTTGTLPDVGSNGAAYHPVTAPWTLVTLSGPVPATTEAVRIAITTLPRAGGSATNVHFDSFSAEIAAVPEPAAVLLGLVGLAGLLRRRR